MNPSIIGRFHHGKKTESAGTAIIVVVPPQVNTKTVLTRVVYTPGATSHLLNVLRSQGTTQVTSDAADSQADLVVDSLSLAKDQLGNSLSENLAANDYIVVRNSKGVYEAHKISSISGTTLTLSASLGTSISAGATVWGMYEISRTAGWPALTFDLTTGAQRDIPGLGNNEETVGIATSPGVNQPLVVYSNNATNAGTLDRLAAAYHRY